MSLLTTFYSKIEEVNKLRGIDRFIFIYNKEFYYTELIDDKWSDPVIICHV